MKRVTGIGGIFFKSRDPKALGEWYRKHLGLEVEEWGGAMFRWVTDENPTGTGTTMWTPFKEETSYFAPSAASFMVNFRVHDLHALLAALRSEGCAVDDKSTSRNSASSAGFKIRKAIASSFGNRQKANEVAERQHGSANDTTPRGSPPHPQV